MDVRCRLCGEAFGAGEGVAFRMHIVACHPGSPEYREIQLAVWARAEHIAQQLREEVSVA